MKINTDVEVQLCGSGPAHCACKYAGKISIDNTHHCSAPNDNIYFGCEYNDNTGNIHFRNKVPVTINFKEI